MKRLVFFILLIPILGLSQPYYYYVSGSSEVKFYTQGQTIPDAITSKIRVLYASSGTIYVRSYFNETQDVVNSIRKLATGNMNASPYRVYLIAKATTDTEAGYLAGTIMHSVSDECTPVGSSNVGYIGGSHMYGIYKVTMAEHGKTIADYGSIWEDLASKQWYLTEISGDDLYFIQKSRTYAGSWYIQDAMPTTGLTHVSGATHTDAIVTTTRAAEMTKSFIKNQNTQVLGNGKVAIQIDKIMVCDFVEVKDYYEAVDPRYMTFNGTWNTGTALTSHDVTYQYQNYGACLIKYSCLVRSELKQLTTLFNMSYPPTRTYSGHTKTWEYLPKTLPIPGGDGDWNFAAIRDITTMPATSLSFTRDYLIDATDPPDRCVFFLSHNDDIHDYGHAMGLITDRYLSVPATRCTNVVATNPFWQITIPYGKNYPWAIMNTDVYPNGIQFDNYGYKVVFDPQLHPNLTACYWVKSDNDYLLYLDAHQSLTNEIITLPAFLQGKTFEVIDTDDGMVINTTGTAIPAAGLDISVTTKGYLVLRLN